MTDQKTISSLCITQGADRPTTATFIGLHERGVKIAVICPSDKPNYKVLKAAGVNVIDLRISKNRDAKAIAAINTVMDIGNYDILHVFNSRGLTNGLAAARGREIKIIAYRGIVGNVSFFDPISWWRWLNPRIDKMVCVADAIRQFFLNMKPAFLRGPDSKYITIHKGHSLDWYQDQPVDLAEFGIPADAFVVGCVANLRPRKGIDDLVAATNYLPVDANLHFLIIGNMDSDKLHSQIAASHYNERIHLAGYRNDAPAVVASCDAMCLPSKKREGLPRAVIEAMSYGVAPIVTDTGGSKELVVDGKSGLVVESGNPKSIAAGIIRLYDDRELCERMGKSARERIANSFRIETTIDKTLELYESLLEDGRPS
jgi:glycosyltransferase involved in cell wall biosynthesis